MSVDSVSVILREFWRHPDRVAALKRGVKFCNKTFGWSPQDVMLHCVRLGMFESFHPAEKSLRRFMLTKQKKLASPHGLTGLFFSVHNILCDRKDENLKAQAAFEVLDKIYAQLRQEMGTAFPFKENKPEPIVEDIEQLIKHLLRLFSSTMSISPEAFLKVAENFFPGFDITNLPDPDKVLMQRYNTYRFHSEPARIVKSLTVVSSPTKGVPMCTFSNFFVSSAMANVRRISGFIIPTRNTLYLLGGMQNGAGLKIMAIDQPTMLLPLRWHGLMTTFDETDSLVCARFVMNPTEAKDHEAAKSGIYNLDSASADFLDEVKPFLGELRNNIRFVLERKVLVDGVQMLQTSMVDEVRRALVAADGSNRIVYADNGELFNPAADSEYTFNSALGVWKDRR